MRGTLVGGVKNEFCVGLGGIDRGRVEEAITAGQMLGPTIGVQNIPLDQLKAVFAPKVLRMLAYMVGLFRVIEVANRASNCITVFE